jgi:hypothetical protein
MRRRLLSTLALALSLTGVCATLALADADPASDVLVSQNVFYPYSPPPTNALQSALNAETAAAGRAHLPIKVAVIASAMDLGGIPSFFGKPQPYANFLDQEIAFGHPNPPLLVVMASGYGVRGLPAAATAAAASLPKPESPRSDDLARAAIAALPKLAAAAGHPIPPGSASGTNGRGGGHASTPVTVVIFALIAVAIAVAVIRFRRWTQPSR